MELTQAYKNKVTKTGTETSFQKAVTSFVNRHADVFKALTRVGAPYGESIRRQTTGSSIRNVVPEEQIDLLQQQLNELSQTIASLSDQVNAHKVSAQANKMQTKATEDIGINRFRALQSEF